MNATNQAEGDAAGKAADQSPAFAAPVINLPKGGGAIRGIGEKFAANPVTGTGSMSVPIATSPGRSGFGPQLSLSYDSGAGNGPFGFGWSLSTPAITRKTEKGLPQYRDAEESDVYVLSGAEDLVPVLRSDGKRFEDSTTFPGYTIHRYRPRVEGLFARIERWTKVTTGEIHWRSITRDNVTTLYGKDNKSRIFDPTDLDKNDPSNLDKAHPTRIFSWLICQSYDDKGNAVVYEYEPEDSQRIFEDPKGQLLALAQERNRNDATRSANRYLKRIKYGNQKPNRNVATWSPTDPTKLPSNTWMFEVVFDYGEGHYTEVAPDAQGRIFAQTRIDSPAGSYWPVRQDPFSRYRAGFEVRTYRLCRRVLMFHHFPQELGTADYLVRSTEFSYAENPIGSFIISVTQSGYVYRPTQNKPNRYLKKSLPPLEFEYSQVPDASKLAQEPIQQIDTRSLENLPVGLDGAKYQWMDLDGEGTSGILTEQADGWYYKRNISANNILSEDGRERTVACFSPVELVASKPALGLARGAQFLDLAGDGQVDLVQMEGPVRGFHERTEDATWEPFQPFGAWPDLNTREPNLKFIDLTGDGHADVLMTENEVLTWYPSLAEEGFGAAIRVSLPADEEKGPRLVFADGTQSIYLADLSGDGLSDLVRIRNGEVCYWPNFGYGLFGTKVTMDNAPWFGQPDQFEQRRIRLADTDGSGTTDILYLGGDGVQIYFNQSGNSWSNAVALPQFPRIDSLASVQALDLLGNGTACLVWSSPLPSDGGRQMYYVDLMGGQKPHLLITTVNNLGAETIVRYSPSTKFYLQDKQEGKPWITKLPFPVHVVERVETLDRISHNRFVTRHAYHHGYFDGEEREFRGFGMVEQWDTDELASLKQSGVLPELTNIDDSSYVPPAYTKTWFHTGIYLGRGHVSDFFAGLLNAEDFGEYFREPGITDAQARELLLDDTQLPVGLTAEEEREACRALKGAMLRQELYALDGTEKEEIPYTITEQNFTIELLQPRVGNRHAVVFSHPREAISYHYERSFIFDPADPEPDPKKKRKLLDPRVTHALTLEVDEFGNVLKEAQVGYGRRRPDLSLLPPDQAKQMHTLITYTENRVTNAIIANDDYRTPLPAETRTYELTGVILPASQNRFSLDEMLTAGSGAVPIPYEQSTTSGVLEKRLIEHARTLFRPDDLGTSNNEPLTILPLATVERMALPGESYKLAFTPGLITEVYGGRVTGMMLNTEARYVHTEGDTNWWIPSGRVFYSPSTADTPAQELALARQHFFLPRRFRDPFHTNVVPTESLIAYDTHDLLMLETRDALGSQVTVGERDVAGNLTILGNDYRVLQPRLVMDPNRNRTEIAFDALGMVVGTAVTGKPPPYPVEGDSLNGFDADLTEATAISHLTNPLGNPQTILQNATTRLVHDLFAYQRTKGQPDPQPPVVYVLARETHDSDPVPPGGLKIQHSFSYSDGFGREIQKKIQAEDGPVPQRDKNGQIIIGADGQPVMTTNDVSPRWVGSGWTVFNNKGKPIRQYEPFFTDTNQFEFDLRIGVSLVLFYDPVGRVVATLHPNHTWEKVLFDPWRQETWDVNDTVLIPDPKVDSDAGDFFDRLPDAAYLPTWYAQRQGGALGTDELAAARKATIHAATPTVTHADSLGRPFLTVAHNKFKYSDTPPAVAPMEEFYSTRVELDIEGNQRAFRDAIVQNGDQEGRIVTRYDYDMLGSRIHEDSMEAGQHWILNDVMSKAIRAWDSRLFLRRMTYDELRRPTGLLVSENGIERLAERTIYGEFLGDANNHRARVYQVFDGAGVITTEAYDFKGNPLRTRRELLPDYRESVDWFQNPTPNDGTFYSSTTYDALNRPATVTTPDRSVYRPTFNEANLLDKVDVNLRGERKANGDLKWTVFVANLNYNAKGQRELISYGNGAETSYEYDPLTFRLAVLKTKRLANADATASELFKTETVVQELRYTYDPIGNVTRIEDAALKTIFYNGQQVEPVYEYCYDSTYRLIDAKGREHIGQAASDFNPPSTNLRDFPFAGLAALIAHPNDMQAMRNYTQRYEYDPVGNFQFMRHVASAGNWTRSYEHNAASLIEPTKQSNRLTKTTVGNGINFSETYTYADAQGDDVQGCMTTINNMKMAWSFKDQLQQVDLSGGGKAYYVYDAGGQRARKVIETQNGKRKKERIYLGGFEVYREFKADGTTIELVRESLHVLDNKQRIALTETQTVDDGNPVNAPVPKQRYQLHNHLGSAVLELAVDGALISYEEYHPYGTTAFQAGPSVTEVSLKRYRYTGKERDEETGLYYHGERYYAAWLGQWVSYDPLGAEVGMNRYSYSRRNPVRFHDPSGSAPIPHPQEEIAQQSLPEFHGTPEEEAAQQSLEVGQSSEVQQSFDVGPYRKTGPGGETPVAGDHVHQVASRTQEPGAPRRSAPQFSEALAVSTKNPSYNDKGGQRVESSINRAAWGQDQSCRPADTPTREGVVTVEASGETSVGESTSATPSQWFEDTKSFYKLREAGVSSDEAYDLVCRSADQLASNDATPARVPDAPRNTPKPLQSGQDLSPELPLNETTSQLPTTSTPAAESPSVFESPRFKAGVTATGEALQGAGTVVTIYAVAQSTSHIVDAVQADIQQGTSGEQTARVVAHEAGGWAGALAGAEVGGTAGLACGPFAEICSPVGALIVGGIGYWSGAGTVDSILRWGTGR